MNNKQIQWANKVIDLTIQAIAFNKILPYTKQEQDKAKNILKIYSDSYTTP